MASGVGFPLILKGYPLSRRTKVDRTISESR